MWSLTSLRTKRISSFRKFRLLPPKDFFDSIGQNRKSSMRANVFRFAPESGHRAMQSACPFRAISGPMHRSKQKSHCVACNVAFSSGPPW